MSAFGGDTTVVTWANVQRCRCTATACSCCGVGAPFVIIRYRSAEPDPEPWIVPELRARARWLDDMRGVRWASPALPDRRASKPTRRIFGFAIGQRRRQKRRAFVQRIRSAP